MEHEDDVSPDRISIARCREILGSEADELSDADVEQICRHADLMAHVVIEMFLDQHSARE
jgi:hypothetical protein